jgi:hypothetical protein
MHLIPHKKQEEIIRSHNRFKVIRAGRKAGKTALEVEKISFLSVISASKLKLSKTVFNTGRKIIYIAPTQKQAREIVWASFKNRLNGVATFHEQRLEITIPNEDNLTTTIMIGGWENRENYRGLTDVVHITFDEIDTLKDFFLNWQDIFRPMFLDTGGTADFIGTPKKESGNLKRLEKNAKTDDTYACFHFTSKDNPFISEAELKAIEKEYEGNYESYKQEILAEHIEDAGSLFRYESIIDIFSNSVVKKGEKFLVVDIADDGNDKSVFSFWEDLEEYRREEFCGLNTEGVIGKIRDYASSEKIPFSNIVVDAIGVGSAVASNSALSGIVGYKSSYSAMKTDIDPVRLPSVHYLKDAPLTSDYKNLRSQCVFTLADLVNGHKIASRVSGKFKELIIEELATYQDASIGDGKRMATQKDDVKSIIGRSPDHSDTFIMRMYFVLKDKMLPNQTEEQNIVAQKLKMQFSQSFEIFQSESNK